MRQPNNHPRVEILLASYNGEQYIREQIESIRNQTYPFWNLYISDDGSSDLTLSIIKDFCNVDERIHLVNEDITFGNPLNNFLSMLHPTNDINTYTFFSDQDDIWMPSKISDTLEIMKKEENIELPCLVFSDLQVVDVFLNEIASSFFEFSGLNPNHTSINQLLVENVATGCTICINAKLKNICCLHMDKIQSHYFVMHDWLLALIAKTFGKIIYLPISTVRYRQHNNNSLGAQKKRLIPSIQDINQAKIALNARTMQAQSFHEVFSPLPNKHEEKIIKEYGDLQNLNPIAAIKTLSKNKLWQNSMLPRLGQITALLIKS